MLWAEADDAPSVGAPDALTRVRTSIVPFIVLVGLPGLLVLWIVKKLLLAPSG